MTFACSPCNLAAMLSGTSSSLRAKLQLFAAILIFLGQLAAGAVVPTPVTPFSESQFPICHSGGASGDQYPADAPAAPHRDHDCALCVACIASLPALLSSSGQPAVPIPQPSPEAARRLRPQGTGPPAVAEGRIPPPRGPPPEA